MSKIRGKDTKPEVTVRRFLHADGYRFRKNIRTPPGTPDIVLSKYRTCIFVNGCFWHGHDGCKYYTHPKTHPEFWEEKVKRNKERDALVMARLEALGWSVITVWECELKNDKLGSTITAVEGQLHRNIQIWEEYKMKRKTDRAFALEEIRKRRAVREVVEAELHEEYKIPKRIVKMSKKINQ